jgi:hypothetical protein
LNDLTLKEKVIVLKGIQAKSISRLRLMIKELSSPKLKLSKLGLIPDQHRPDLIKRLQGILFELEEILDNPTDQQIQHMIFNLRLIENNSND